MQDDFTDKFPSLKDSDCKCYRNNNIEAFHYDDIQKHCLDKKKVKEALESKEALHAPQGESLQDAFIKRVKKELGLK